MAGQERGTEGGRQLNEQSCVYQGIRFESLVLEFKIKKLCVNVFNFLSIRSHKCINLQIYRLWFLVFLILVGILLCMLIYN